MALRLVVAFCPNNDQIKTKKEGDCIPFLRLLLPELDRQGVRQSVTGTGLCRLKAMAVNIQRGGGLAVSQSGGDGTHILAVEDQKGGVQMPELVDAIERQALFFAEALKPLIGLLEADRGAVLLSEEASAFMPLVP